MNYTTYSTYRPQPGDRVRIVTPLWDDGTACNAWLPAGAIGTVTEGVREDGDIRVLPDGYEEAEGGTQGFFVGQHNVEPVVEAEPIEPTLLGTATVNVEVRFFIDGTDVTDRIKTLFA